MVWRFGSANNSRFQIYKPITVGRDCVARNEKVGISE